MKKETKTVIYDECLKIEAYRFEGIVQHFPNHFHTYYVIGFVESGQRKLSCRNKEYNIRHGDIVLFGPGDNHACVQSDGGTLDYRGINLSQEVMRKLAEEITGVRELPGFSQNVIRDEEIGCYLKTLHEMVMEGAGNFGKEETLLLLISALMQRFGQGFDACVPACRAEIAQACRFMEQHYMQHVDLEQICHCVGLSKSTLLRAFTREKGITPYSYLQNIRIGEAKKILEKGVLPAEAALRTGFSDQSHFTNYFSRFIGVTPGVYRTIFLTKKHAKENRDEQ